MCCHIYFLLCFLMAQNKIVQSNGLHEVKIVILIQKPVSTIKDHHWKTREKQTNSTKNIWNQIGGEFNIPV